MQTSMESNLISIDDRVQIDSKGLNIYFASKYTVFCRQTAFKLQRDAYSTIITEAKQQMPCDPDVIMCCVGRGDLLNGIIHGIENVGWKHVPLVAMETVGAHSYNTSCLGALRCSNTAIENHKKYNIISKTVPDKTAVMACLKFAAIYGDVINKLQAEGKLKNIKNALIVVCGGCVSFNTMLKWKNQFDL
ncbi:hypothetical protein KUTeg_009816 [Tegillarca granosa]|uniref:L-serine ammonia-lyase n=1 Tax=Tegillarca granosa TaxID=220873 RepID=A0ABQ9F4Z0_TEGGR|nr:hypothetical protein KUTeg_009816 [Tegillarca granosa]